MEEESVYDYRSRGGLVIATILLLVVLAFWVVFANVALTGPFKFNGHPASSGERTFAVVGMSLILGTFAYLIAHGILRHVNERIVWVDGQVSWADALGRERVRCSESDITGLRGETLGASKDLIRYEIVTKSGNIRFLNSLPRCAELRARVERLVGAEKSSPQDAP